MASPLDIARLRAYQVPGSSDRYDPRETILYALGVGAGLADIDEQVFLFERELMALPTMALVLGTPGFWLMDRATGIDWQRAALVEVALKLARPLEPAGDVVGSTRIGAIFDGGEGRSAMLRTTRSLVDGTFGRAIATVEERWNIRESGGFGGERMADPREQLSAPDSMPTGSLALATGRNQAALYRLTGDRNPIHIDRTSAQRAGHERPILHPAATTGVIGRALIHLACNGDPGRLSAIRTLFAAPVEPGDTIHTDLWVLDDTQIRFRATVGEETVAEGVAEIDRFAAMVA